MHDPALAREALADLPSDIAESPLFNGDLAPVPAARRDLFLDESDDRAAIASAIDRLVDLALRRGAAIGIAHPRPETIAALAERLPRLRDQGVELVPVSFLAERGEELPE